MDLAERFRTAVVQAYDADTASADLIPVVLSRACVEVLPVAGAGLSITDELRVPLGASDDTVSLAERLQATLGEGPCLTATQEQEPLAADLGTIEARWPMFHRQLLTQTPFRSVISFPLNSRDGRLRLGALDLYLTISDRVPDFFLDQVCANIADPISVVLFEKPTPASGRWAKLPPWLDNSFVRGRMHVWVAVGMLIEHANLSNADALAALRAFAFGHDTNLDDVAREMMDQRLQPEAVLA
jgi:hypothetical protein